MPLRPQLPDYVLEYTRAIAAAGGRALIVGGYVRDTLLGLDSKDYDFEVSGLDMDQLEQVLRRFGEVITVGRTFGVLMLKSQQHIDFSVPRRDNKVGRGHADFRCEFDPHMSFADAARRRDLTMNSMGLDPLTGEIIDPHGGQRDLAARRLRATDPASFGEDPLRAVRVAQFRARFEMEPDAELAKLCAEISLDDLSGERLWTELEKLFLKSRRPSLGLEFLRTTGLLRFFPELAAMVDVPQDPIWHPEGDVWVHTMLVVDEAARARTGVVADDLLLLYGALCHDIGKPLTTFTDAEGRVRSPNHEPEGVTPALQFLARLRAPRQFSEQVGLLVRYHLAPATLPKQDSSPRAYRRLARRLGAGQISLEFLWRLARADHFGRTTPDALAREFPAGDAFLAMSKGLRIAAAAPRDVVLGRHLLERGLQPGPAIGVILDRCREIQDETGSENASEILDAALGESSLTEYLALGRERALARRARGHRPDK
ncbi:MAG: CCA tRNA nucleotidyltransferase [Planctomycetota bacterium]